MAGFSRNGETLCWDIGAYHTWPEEKAGFPKLRAVVRAMAEHRPAQLQYEHRHLVRASFDRMFGHNAKKQLAAVEDEMGKLQGGAT